MIDRHLSCHLPAAPAELVDVGGGAGHQALPLARRPPAGSNDNMKVVCGGLAGQDEVGAALRTRRFSPPDFSSGYHASCSIEAAARRSTEESGTGGGKELVTLRDGFIEF